MTWKLSRCSISVFGLAGADGWADVMDQQKKMHTILAITELFEETIYIYTFAKANHVYTIYLRGRSTKKENGHDFV